MSHWTKPLKIAFPIEHLALANRLAAIIDPDTGGAETFSAERTVNDGTLITAKIPFKADFAPIVLGRDLPTWQTVIPQLAAAKACTDNDGNPLPHDSLTAAEIETLHVTILIGDDIPPPEIPEEPVE